MAFRVISADGTPKELIDRHASRLMTEKGNRFTIRELCGLAGISVGTFYNYYKNKDELILERVRIYGEYLAAASERSGEDTAESRLHAIVRAHVQYVKQRGKTSVGEVYRCMLRLPRALDKEHSRFYRSFRDALEQGARDGTLRLPASADDCAMYLLLICRGSGFSWCSEDGEDDRVLLEGQAACERLIDSFIAR